MPERKFKTYEEMFALNKQDDERKAMEERPQSADARPLEIPIERLRPFAHHPFKLYSEEKMQEMLESVKAQGILVPILARPIKGSVDWEIISGHNRVEAARLAGLTTVPGYIRDVDDNTATIIMVDSNFYQRDKILASEKAFAYKLKLDAIKRQGERTDLTSVQIAQKSEGMTSREIIAESAGESQDNIRRYIRLTELIPALLDKVDTGRLGFIPAVSLSYLTQEEQAMLNDLIETDGKSVSIQQADALKHRSQNGTLDEDIMLSIMTERNQPMVKALKIPFKKVRDFFPDKATPKEMEDITVKALKAWFAREDTHTAQTFVAVTPSPIYSGIEDESEEELEA